MKRTLIFILLFLSFACGAAAQEHQNQYGPVLDRINDRNLLEILPERTQKDLLEMGLEEPDPEKILNFDSSKLVEYIASLIESEIETPRNSLFRIIGTVVLLSVIEALHSTSEQNKSLTQVFSITSTLVVCAYMAKPLVNCIEATSGIIMDCSQFILSFLPVFTGLITACGQAGTASAMHIVLFAICQVASNFAAEVLIGLVGLYAALSVVGAASPALKIDQLTGSIKTVITWMLGLTMTVFVGVLTLSSVVAASGDSIGTRTARFVLGSFVPVVGGALSEAFTTAQSCLNMVRSCTGVYAIIAVAVLFLPVMVRLICWYIAAGISSIIAALLGVDSIGRLMKSMGTAIGILLAMLLCFMLILLVTFTLVLMLGQGMS